MKSSSEIESPRGPAAWLAEARTLFVQTVTEWLTDRGPERGAALSFYVILSLGPLLALLVGLLELLVSEGTVRPAVIDTVTALAGTQAASTAATILEQVESPNLLSPASILTLATLLFAATAAFANVRDALNAIWGAQPEAESVKERIIGFLRTRWRGFLMIGITGVIVTVSFLVTSLATIFYELLEASLPLDLPVIRILDAATSLILLGLAFGIVFRTLPGVRVEWSSIFVGAFATAAVFVLGKMLVTPFLSAPSWTSYYGPGTSIVVFLAWVYFSAQIFFLGAEFTQVWSRRKGGVLDPSPAGEEG
jgi:membrane protein